MLLLLLEWYVTTLFRKFDLTLSEPVTFTLQEDLNQAREAISDAIAEGRLMPSDYCPRLLEGSLRTGSDCLPVDLLIRTSGETRLSDFMATKVIARL